MVAGLLVVRLLAQMGAVLLEELECFSVAVVGHVVQATHLFNGEGIHRAPLSLKPRNGLAEAVHGCLFLCRRVGSQVCILIVRGKCHSSSPSSSLSRGSVSAKGKSPPSCRC